MKGVILRIGRIFPLWARITGVAVAVVGLVFIAVGALLWMGSRPYSDGQTVAGAVVDNRAATVTVGEGRDAEELDRFTAIVGYEVDGVEYQIERQSTAVEPEALDTPVDVSYRPADPGAGRIVGDGSSAGLILAIMGAIFAALGLMSFLLGPKYARSVLESRETT